MRTFAQKPKATQQTTSSRITMPARARFGQSREVNSILQLQRTIGNQAVQRLLQSNAEELQAESATTASTGFGHDFSRIPIFRPSPVQVQPKLTVGAPGDMYEQEVHSVQKRRAGTALVQRQEADQATAAPPGWVYLASGHHLTPGIIEDVKQQTRLLFLTYRVPFQDSWMASHDEDGMPTLLLKWDPAWGQLPSLWMDPPVLEAFLKGRFAEESFELADTPYGSEELELAFTEEEQRWIREVLELDGISLLLRAYKELPPVVLHRVVKLWPGAAGQTRGQHVAISHVRKKEEEFKGTLIHEIVHFVENETGDLTGSMAVPATLVTWMNEPTIFDFDPYAFGWFLHPKSKRYLHFDLPQIWGFSPDFTIFGYPELIEIYKGGAWEHSPMPISGKNISAEEDLAASISMYLMGGDRRKKLQTEYPLRYRLMEWLFGTHLPELEAKRLQEGP